LRAGATTNEEFTNWRETDAAGDVPNHDKNRETIEKANQYSI